MMYEIGSVSDESKRLLKVTKECLDIGIAQCYPENRIGNIGYEIARPPVYTQPPVVVQQPPVIVQQSPVVVQGQNCSPWTQIQNPDGSVTTTRTCQ